MREILLIVGLAGAFPPAAAAAPSPSAGLKVQLFDGQKKTLSPRQLSTLKTAELKVTNPVLKKEKTYLGYWLSDVLKLAGFKDADRARGDEILFTCADGYQPSVHYKKAEDIRLFLAFQEKGNPKRWQKVPQGKAFVTPAPFYVMGPTAETYEVFPWPYQVVALEIISFREKYPKLYPAGLEKLDASSPVFRGFDIFKDNCIACHTVNLQGGDLGPELNIPKNITEYWDRDTLKEFIADASSFRARSKMTSFKHLGPDYIDDVVTYLEHMKDHKDVEAIKSAAAK